MALNDLGMFASIPDEDEEKDPVAEAPQPATSSAVAPPPVTPQGNGDLGMFADIPDEAPKPRDDSFLAQTGRAVQNAVHGAIDPIASVPAALELAARPAQKLSGANVEENVEDTLGFKTTAFLKGLASIVGEADKTDQSLTQQVASGIGSVVGIGAPALAASVASPAAGVAVGAGLGSAQMAVQMFEEARAKGADEDTALLYGGLGGVIGLSDILPIGHALKFLPPAVRMEVTNAFMTKALQIGAGAGEEALQEYGQQVAQNLAANGVLKEDRAWDEGALQSAVVGAIVGGGVATAGSFLPDRKPKAEAIPDDGITPELAAAVAPPVADPLPFPAAEPAMADQTRDEALSPEVAAVVESPREKAIRISKERARKVLADGRAATAQVESSGAGGLTASDAQSSVAPAGNEGGPPAPEPVPGADTALLEEVPGADTALDESLTPPQVAEQVTSEVTPAAAPEETIPTVPEDPQTIELQRTALQEGKRMAVLYPYGTTVPAEFGGTRLRRAFIPNVGIVDYDSRQINGATLRGMAKLGKLNELLGLGPSSKADVAASVQAGSPEVAVTERTPDGVEVKAAAGTEALAPVQVEALEATKAAPENVVQVETPQSVIEARQGAPAPVEEQLPPEPENARPTPLEIDQAPLPAPKATPVVVAKAKKGAPKPRASVKDPGDVVREARRAEEAKRISAERAPKPKPKLVPDKSVEAREMLDLQADEDRFANKELKDIRKREETPTAEESQGKNWTKMEKAERAENNAKADALVREFAPMEAIEAPFVKRTTEGVNARSVIQSRAEAMLEASRKAGVSLPERQKKGADTSTEHGDGVALLILARDLGKLKNPKLEDFIKFVTREKQVRGGYKSEVQKERAAEGATKKSQAGAVDVEKISSTAALAPTTGDEDVQTSVSASRRRGASVFDDERAAKPAPEKLSPEDKKRLIAEMNAKLNPALDKHVTSEVTAIDKAQPQQARFTDKVEAEQRRKKLYDAAYLAAAEKGISDPESSPIEVVLSIDSVDVSTLADNILDKLPRKKGVTDEEKLQDDFVPLFLRRAKALVPDMAVVVISDANMDLILPGAVAYYRPDKDFIAVRESALDDYRDFVHTFTHEITHALFFHQLEADPKLRGHIDDLMTAVRYDAEVNGDGDQYGFTNAHEFLAEAWSNAEFQQILARTPVSQEWWAKSGLPVPKEPALRTVLNWFKQRVAALLDPFTQLMRMRTKGKTALDVALDVGGALMELAPTARSAYYAGQTRMWISDELANPARLALEDPPKTLRDKLAAAGLGDVEADAVAELIEEEFGGKATDEEIAALAGEFSKPVTSESDLEAKVDATPPGGKAAVAALTSGEDYSKETKVRAFFLKTMTLDFLRQKYGKLFVDKTTGESHLDTFIKWLQRRDAIVNRVSAPHDMDAAEYIEFSRHHPDEAQALAELAMDATRYDVNLGPNADNSHLGVNSKRGLQAKKRLAELNARFAKMTPAARKLYDQMTDHYRSSHNAAKRQLAANVLDMLDLKLTPAQRDDLIEKVIKGKLTEADKVTVGSTTVFRALKNAASLRAIEGAYFPQMRFGNHVVITQEEIEKPTLNSLMVFGKAVPVTSEVTGNVVRFTADQSIRGVGAELDRQVSDYVAGHPLRSLRVSRRWKDRKTGELVEKGEQIVGHDYDLTYEVELQTKGVHYFESKGDAKKFAKESTSAKTSPVLERRSEQATNVALEGTDVSAIVHRINARTDLSVSERSTMKRALEEAVVASMPGNRSPARYQARRNVLGASKDIGRAAATYGKAQGNFMATLETAPHMREAMSGMGKIEREVFKANAGAVSQVMNELRARVERIENPDTPNELAQAISTISFFDKLASPAASVVNAMQVAMNAGPVLGGRYGNVKAGAAIMSAYGRMGAVGTIGRGIGAAAKSIAKWQASAIDTSNIIGSVRKKLGPKYDDLINELISRGALDENAGFEIAQAVMDKKGFAQRNIARFDRAVRQLPNAVEVVNRVVTAVATYDLATAKGASPETAIQEAFDTVVTSQGDYRAVNTPRFMKQGLLSFAMQFRKYALLQTQLYADMFARITHGATAKEKGVAAKQMINLMTMQVLVGGALGLPGLELVKAGVMLIGMMGLSDDDWEDWQNKMTGLLAQVTGQDWANMISKGIVTQALGVDVSSRMSQADLWTGFAPKSLDADGITQYLGGIFLGAPGQTLVDWMVKAPQKLRDGKPAEALELLVPVKTLADTVKAWRKYEEGEFDERDAALQAFGFKSAKPIWSNKPATAEKDDEKSRGFNEKANFKKEADKLRAAYKAATTNGERARIKGLIRDYNKRKKPEGVFGISLDNLTKKDTSP